MKMFEELEERVRRVEDDVKERVDELKERIVVNEAKADKWEIKDGLGNSATIGGEEEVNDIERRKKQCDYLQGKGIESEVADDRKAGDMLFVHEFCNDVLKIDVKSGDIEKMFRLGRREEGKDRPLLVRFAGLDKKQEVLARVKDLKTSSERFKGISISHDLTPRQRETVMAIRKNALDKLEEEIRSGSGDDRKVGNFKIIVVGQQTNKPRAIRVPVKEQM